MRKTARLGALGAGALTLVLGMGGGQVADAAGTPVAAPNPVTTAPGGNDRAGGQRINDPAATAPGYQRNTRGLTYGFTRIVQLRSAETYSTSRIHQSLRAPRELRHLL